MKALVRVSVDIEIEVAEHAQEDFEFIIEQHGCPGTGRVGSELESIIEKANEDGYCWACGRNGENHILSVDGIPFDTEAERAAYYRNKRTEKATS